MDVPIDVSLDSVGGRKLDAILVEAFSSCPQSHADTDRLVAEKIDAHRDDLSQCHGAYQQLGFVFDFVGLGVRCEQTVEALVKACPQQLRWMMMSSTSSKSVHPSMLTFPSKFLDLTCYMQPPNDFIVMRALLLAAYGPRANLVEERAYANGFLSPDRIAWVMWDNHIAEPGGFVFWDAYFSRNPDGVPWRNFCVLLMFLLYTSDAVYDLYIDRVISNNYCDVAKWGRCAGMARNINRMSRWDAATSVHVDLFGCMVHACILDDDRYDADALRKLLLDPWVKRGLEHERFQSGTWFMSRDKGTAVIRSTVMTDGRFASKSIRLDKARVIYDVMASEYGCKTQNIWKDYLMRKSPEFLELQSALVHWDKRNHYLDAAMYNAGISVVADSDNSDNSDDGIQTAFSARDQTHAASGAGSCVVC